MSDIERERPMLAVVDNGNDADINLGLGRHAETPAVVFLSYSHDNEEHRTRVLSLSERLRRDGFDARLDRYVNGSPAQGWPRWMLDQLDDAVWVLVVCTETYYRRFRGNEQPDLGRGVDFEGLMISQELYESRRNTRFLPVMFAPTDTVYIPDPLRPSSYHVLTEEGDYTNLLAAMRGVAGVEPAPIGSVVLAHRATAAPISFDISAGARPESDWPVKPPEIEWAMADHSEAREAFRALLSRASSKRLLSVRGPSETGKSHMAIQMHANALKIPTLLCGRFNFKGTTNMEDELRAFANHLGLPLPAGERLNDRLNVILQQLTRRSHPTALIFDTYESAGEAVEWIEKLLLHELATAGWLRVVVVGQRVPERTGQLWESVASRPIDLTMPGPQDWYEYGCEYCDDPDLELEFVEKAHRRAGGRPTVLASLIRQR